MFSADQFRAKAREYTLRMKDAVDGGALRELKRLEQSFTGLANNEEWLAQRVENSLRPENGGSRAQALKLNLPIRQAKLTRQGSRGVHQFDRELGLAHRL
jgi:hypothetical protein